MRTGKNKIDFPLDEYKASGYGFGEAVSYNKVNWGIHLGEDCRAKEATPVKAIAKGKIVYSELHPGSKKKGNWGNIIIIEHKYPNKNKLFYSLYGHLGKRLKNAGDSVKKNELIGNVGKAYSAENGWWESHLHFAIYIGPWKEKVLPGYYKKEQKRTRLSYWKNPTAWIARNN